MKTPLLLLLLSFSLQKLCFSQTSFEKNISIENHIVYSGKTIRSGDGGIAICGSISDLAHTTYKAYLVKCDANADIQWQKTYADVNDYGFATSLIQTRDMGYIITEDKGAVIKVDSSGGILWI